MSEEVWWEDGLVTYISEGSVDPGLPVQLTRATEEKLRKFFQHERDRELGRWRSKEDPNYFVIPHNNDPNTVTVVYERDNSRQTAHRSQDYSVLRGFKEVGDEYFADHPEPKPWHNAKPGEVWLFKGRANPAPEAFTVHRDTRNWINPFGVELSEKYRKNRPYGESHDPNFTPRRIWPEENNG